MKCAWAACRVALGCALVLGCNRAAPSDSERCSAQAAGAPIDPVLLAFLSRARAAHHLADAHESEGDLAAAVSPLAELVTGPRPKAPAPGGLAPEVREVLADTRARLADLRSRLGAFDQAVADVEAGLENARDATYFRGHLLETEGLVEERRAKALEATHAGGVEAAKQRAIVLLEQAMAIQSVVLENSAPPPVDAGKAIPGPAASSPP